MVVTGHNRYNPFRPRVLEYENEKGQRYQDNDGNFLLYDKKELIKPRAFNLDDQRALKILECDGEDLSYLNK